MRFRIKGRGRPKRKTGMNGLETWYAEDLEARRRAGEIQHWAFEPVRFKLGEGAWYKPDFMVMLADGEIQFIETKGHWEEAARVRIKVAAELHPFKFIALTCRCKSKRWSVAKIETFGE